VPVAVAAAVARARYGRTPTSTTPAPTSTTRAPTSTNGTLGQ